MWKEQKKQREGGRPTEEERDSKIDRETEIRGWMVKVTVRHECGKNMRDKERERHADK